MTHPYQDDLDTPECPETIPCDDTPPSSEDSDGISLLSEKSPKTGSDSSDKLSEDSSFTESNESSGEEWVFDKSQQEAAPSESRSAEVQETWSNAGQETGSHAVQETDPDNLVETGSDELLILPEVRHTELGWRMLRVALTRQSTIEEVSEPSESLTEDDRLHHGHHTLLEQVMEEQGGTGTPRSSDSEDDTQGYDTPRGYELLTNLSLDDDVFEDSGIQEGEKTDSYNENRNVSESDTIVDDSEHTQPIEDNVTDLDSQDVESLVLESESACDLIKSDSNEAGVSSEHEVLIQECPENIKSLSIEPSKESQILEIGQSDIDVLVETGYKEESGECNASKNGARRVQTQFNQERERAVRMTCDRETEADSTTSTEQAEQYQAASDISKTITLKENTTDIKSASGMLFQLTGSKVSSPRHTSNPKDTSDPSNTLSKDSTGNPDSHGSSSSDPHEESYGGSSQNIKEKCTVISTASHGEIQLSVEPVHSFYCDECEDTVDLVTNVYLYGVQQHKKEVQIELCPHYPNYHRRHSSGEGIRTQGSKETKYSEETGLGGSIGDGLSAPNTAASTSDGSVRTVSAEFINSVTITNVPRKKDTETIKYDIGDLQASNWVCSTDSDLQAQSVSSTRKDLPTQLIQLTEKSTSKEEDVQPLQFASVTEKLSEDDLWSVIEADKPQEEWYWKVVEHTTPAKDTSESETELCQDDLVATETTIQANKDDLTASHDFHMTTETIIETFKDDVTASDEDCVVSETVVQIGQDNSTTSYTEMSEMFEVSAENDSKPLPSDTVCEGKENEELFSVPSHDNVYKSITIEEKDKINLPSELNSIAEGMSEKVTTADMESSTEIATTNECVVSEVAFKELSENAEVGEHHLKDKTADSSDKIMMSGTCEETDDDNISHTGSSVRVSDELNYSKVLISEEVDPAVNSAESLPSSDHVYKSVTVEQHPFDLALLTQETAIDDEPFPEETVNRTENENQVPSTEHVYKSVTLEQNPKLEGQTHFMSKTEEESPEITITNNDAVILDSTSNQTGTSTDTLEQKDDIAFWVVTEDVSMDDQSTDRIHHEHSDKENGISKCNVTCENVEEHEEGVEPSDAAEHADTSERGTVEINSTVESDLSVVHQETIRQEEDVTEGVAAVEHSQQVPETEQILCGTDIVTLEQVTVTKEVNMDAKFSSEVPETDHILRKTDIVTSHQVTLTEHEETEDNSSSEVPETDLTLGETDIVTHQQTGTTTDTLEQKDDIAFWVVIEDVSMDDQGTDRIHHEHSDKDYGISKCNVTYEDDEEHEEGVDNSGAAEYADTSKTGNSEITVESELSVVHQETIRQEEVVTEGVAAMEHSQQVPETEQILCGTDIVTLEQVTVTKEVNMDAKFSSEVPETDLILEETDVVTHQQVTVTMEEKTDDDLIYEVPETDHILRETHIAPRQQVTVTTEEQNVTQISSEVPETGHILEETDIVTQQQVIVIKEEQADANFISEVPDTDHIFRKIDNVTPHQITVTKEEKTDTHMSSEVPETDHIFRETDIVPHQQITVTEQEATEDNFISDIPETDHIFRETHMAPRQQVSVTKEEITDDNFSSEVQETDHILRETPRNQETTNQEEDVTEDVAVSEHSQQVPETDHILEATDIVTIEQVSVTMEEKTDTISSSEVQETDHILEETDIVPHQGTVTAEEKTDTSFISEAPETDLTLEETDIVTHQMVTVTKEENTYPKFSSEVPETDFILREIDTETHHQVTVTMEEKADTYVIFEAVTPHEVFVTKEEQTASHFSSEVSEIDNILEETDIVTHQEVTVATEEQTDTSFFSEAQETDHILRETDIVTYQQVTETMEEKADAKVTSKLPETEHMLRETDIVPRQQITVTKKEKTATVTMEEPTDTHISSEVPETDHILEETDIDPHQMVTVTKERKIDTNFFSEVPETDHILRKTNMPTPHQITVAEQENTDTYFSSEVPEIDNILEETDNVPPQQFTMTKEKRTDTHISSNVPETDHILRETDTVTHQQVTVTMEEKVDTYVSFEAETPHQVSVTKEEQTATHFSSEVPEIENILEETDIVTHQEVTVTTEEKTDTSFFSEVQETDHILTETDIATQQQVAVFKEEQPDIHFSSEEISTTQEEKHVPELVDEKTVSEAAALAEVTETLAQERSSEKENTSTTEKIQDQPRQQGRMAQVNPNRSPVKISNRAIQQLGSPEKLSKAVLSQIMMRSLPAIDEESVQSDQELSGNTFAQNQPISMTETSFDSYIDIDELEAVYVTPEPRTDPKSDSSIEVTPTVQGPFHNVTTRQLKSLDSIHNLSYVDPLTPDRGLGATPKDISSIGVKGSGKLGSSQLKDVEDSETKLEIHTMGRTEAIRDKGYLDTGRGDISPLSLGDSVKARPRFPSLTRTPSKSKRIQKEPHPSLLRESRFSVRSRSVPDLETDLLSYDLPPLECVLDQAISLLRPGESPAPLPAAGPFPSCAPPRRTFGPSDRARALSAWGSAPSLNIGSPELEVFKEEGSFPSLLDQAISLPSSEEAILALHSPPFSSTRSSVTLVDRTHALSAWGSAPSLFPGTPELEVFRERDDPSQRVQNMPGHRSRSLSPNKQGKAMMKKRFFGSVESLPETSGSEVSPKGSKGGKANAIKQRAMKYITAKRSGSADGRSPGSKPWDVKPGK